MKRPTPGIVADRAVWVGVGVVLSAGVTLSGVFLLWARALLSSDGYVAGLSELDVPHARQPTREPLVAGDPEPDGSLVLHEEMFGRYTFGVWLDNRRAGELWLRAREVGSGDLLSGETMFNRTRIAVVATEGDGVRFVNGLGQAVIYEGDPGEHYFARFEVWFQAEGGVPELLGDQVFRVEGWAH